MGRLLGGTGLFPENVFAVWRQLPGLLVTVMSASLLLGEHLPPFRKLWSISGSHVIMISVMSMGQFAVGGTLVWLLLEPIFGINRKAGALLEMSFNGGHGTLAGLTRSCSNTVSEISSMSGLGLRLSASSAGSSSVRRSSTTQFDRPRSPSCGRLHPPLTKTSTSIIICRAPTIGQWTSGKGWLK
jgi:hypothetical protein